MVRVLTLGSGGLAAPHPWGHRQSQALVRSETSPGCPDQTHTAAAPKDCFSLVPMSLYSAQTKTLQGAGSPSGIQ